ncbi:hypothetical protein GCM10010123_20900 [Pilimelia anulata]|uniref:HTH merR-type domain-containing protein n=1 Tax=Pilimelia anulata TaxID=53371 RepID=A0A8J3B5C4_9ACTN|nr:MerR family transcriptional regulator [Pilimelia anulata]GGJ90876.1 hypothetical protein GCM10010123_20900 [Pilimelia anulata]
MRTLLRIGELAHRAGVSPRTIDHYTQLGLLTPADRSAGGFRLYPPESIELIKTIRTAEANGISLDQLARALAVGAAATAPTLDKLHADTAALQELLTVAPPHLAGLLALLTSRAHALIITALQLAGTIG